jgi:hypothetical protein
MVNHGKFVAYYRVSTQKQGRSGLWPRSPESRGCDLSKGRQLEIPKLSRASARIARNWMKHWRQPGCIAAR